MRLESGQKSVLEREELKQNTSGQWKHIGPRQCSCKDRQNTMKTQVGGKVKDLSWSLDLNELEYEPKWGSSCVDSQG